MNKPIMPHKRNIRGGCWGQPSSALESYSGPLKGGCMEDGSGGVLALVIIIVIILFVMIVGCACYGTYYYTGSAEGGAAPATGFAAKVRAAFSSSGGKVKELKSGDEAKALLAGKEPAIIFMHMPGCGFCIKADPEVARAAMLNKNITFAKLEAKNAGSLAQEKAITGFPTFLANFGEGKYVGWQGAEKMQQILAAAKTKAQAAAAAHGAGGVRSSCGGNAAAAMQMQPRAPAQQAMQAAAGPSTVQEVTEAQAMEALKGAAPAIVFVYADWCGFCKRMYPVLEQAAARSPRVKFWKLNEKATSPEFKKSATGFPFFLTNFGERKYVGYKDLDTFMRDVVSKAGAK